MVLKRYIYPFGACGSCSAGNARYAVPVNTVLSARQSSKRAKIPGEVQWINSNELVPRWLRSHTNAEMAEGVAWKLAPVRICPTLYELSLDNDVVLWEIPRVVGQWLMSPTRDVCLLAADLRPALGQFAHVCNDRSLNSDVPGLPPDFDMETMLEASWHNPV